MTTTDSRTSTSPRAAEQSAARSLAPAKFYDPRRTVDGAERAFVEIEALETVWFNTGTLCNIECLNCYIESSPSNDRLEYLSAREVEVVLDEIAACELPVREIGFTGGEPFMNPAFLDMTELALQRSFDVLVLTNAMRPMMRPGIRERLLSLQQVHGRRLHLRVSVDHHTAGFHESERGVGSWPSMLAGLRWLAAHGFRLSIAARTRWDEEVAAIRAGFEALFGREGIPVDAQDPGQLVLFPEMDASLDVPEITVDCWQAVGTSPADMMCARSRMVVKRRGARAPAVVACTLLPYDSEFELGERLATALGPVYLNHPHCAKFCVLGGGSCSVGA